MGRVFLYQIAYSEETWDAVPASLLPLDNRANQRPDWAEYWPIRRFLVSEILDENSFYGFLSPRFIEKLGVMPEDLVDFIASCPNEIEVAIFSPFFDHVALFKNVFEQGEFFHPGLMDLCRQILAKALPGTNLDELVNTFENGVFCNYFAAKPCFWREWLELGERIFAIAESQKHPLAAALNRNIGYRDQPMPAKVFVIERIASLLLATKPKSTILKFSRSSRTVGFAGVSTDLLACLNRLKVEGQEKPQLLKAFFLIQREILEDEQIGGIRRALVPENIELGFGHASSGYEKWSIGLVQPPAAPEKFSLAWLLRRLLGLC